MLLDIVSGVLC